MQTAIAEIQETAGRANGLPQFTPSSVQSSQSYEIALSRSFVVLSPKELKKELGVEKLAQKHVSGVPIVKVPSEEKPGTMEESYWFKDEAPFRRGELRIHATGSMVQCPLVPEKHRWGGQADAMFKQVLTDHCAGKGKVVIDKGKNLLSLREFLAKQGKAVPSSAAGPSQGGYTGGTGDSQTSEEEEAEMVHDSDGDSVNLASLGHQSQAVQAAPRSDARSVSGMQQQSSEAAGACQIIQLCHHSH